MQVRYFVVLDTNAVMGIQSGKKALYCLAFTVKIVKYWTSLREALQDLHDDALKVYWTEIGRLVMRKHCWPSSKRKMCCYVEQRGANGLIGLSLK